MDNFTDPLFLAKFKSQLISKDQNILNTELSNTERLVMMECSIFDILLDNYRIDISIAGPNHASLVLNCYVTMAEILGLDASVYDLDTVKEKLENEIHGFDKVDNLTVHDSKTMEELNPDTVWEQQDYQSARMFPKTETLDIKPKHDKYLTELLISGWFDEDDPSILDKRQMFKNFKNNPKEFDQFIDQCIEIKTNLGWVEFYYYPDNVSDSLDKTNDFANIVKDLLLSNDYKIFLIKVSTNFINSWFDGLLTVLYHEILSSIESLSNGNNLTEVENIVYETFREKNIPENTDPENNIALHNTTNTDGTFITTTNQTGNVKKLNFPNKQEMVYEIIDSKGYVVYDETFERNPNEINRVLNMYFKN